jgi:uncharacterized small protein (DUF1192 family)
MALFDEADPFGRAPKAPPVHEIGQALDALSAHELAERIAMLQAEIARLEAMRVSKEASKRAADAFFKQG